MSSARKPLYAEDRRLSRVFLAIDARAEVRLLLIAGSGIDSVTHCHCVPHIQMPFQKNSRSFRLLAGGLSAHLLTAWKTPECCHSTSKTSQLRQSFQGFPFTKKKNVEAASGRVSQGMCMGFASNVLNGTWNGIYGLAFYTNGSFKLLCWFYEGFWNVRHMHKLPISHTMFQWPP